MQPTDYPHLNNGTNRSPASLNNNNQGITNQESHSSRASTIIPIEPQPLVAMDLLNRSATQPAFKTLYDEYSHLISDVLFNCNLPSILTLRLVSKAFWLASIKNTDTGYNPLLHNAAISFQHDQLHPDINSSIFEKYAFCNNNQMEINVTITLAELLNPSSTLQSLPEDRLKLTLRLTNGNQLNQAQTLFLNQPNTKFINKIKTLDLTPLYLKNNATNSINLLFIAISQNLAFFSSFTRLLIGKIDGIILQPSKAFNNITNLTINTVNTRCVLNLPDSFNNLKNFTLGCVEDHSTFTLPNSACNLTKLHIGKIGLACILKFPPLLNSLTDFSIGTLWKGSVTIDLPLSLDNLINLSIGCVEDNTVFNLPGAISLTTLSIEKIKGNANFSLLDLSDSLKTLQNLTIKCVENGATLTLPKSIENLTTLHIGKIEPKSTVTLPALLDKLTNFFIGSTWDSSAMINLPASLGNLVNLSIDCIEDNTVLNLPIANNVAKLTIKKIGRNATLKLDSLENLDSLTILTINTGCHLQLPALKNISILCIEKQAVLNLPPLDNCTSFSIHKMEEDAAMSCITLNSLKSLFIGDLDLDSKLNLPARLDNLETLHIENLKRSCRVWAVQMEACLREQFIPTFNLPDSLPNLTTLTIGDIIFCGFFKKQRIRYCVSLKLPHALDNLKKLSIGKMPSQCNITWPRSLNNLTDLTLNGCHTSISLVKQFSVRTVFCDPEKYEDDIEDDDAPSTPDQRAAMFNACNQRILDTINERLLNVIVDADHPDDVAKNKGESDNCSLQ